ncbi:peptide MFS transporter [uncultured Campylobacter sp.]|uniref:peptide MFS transporter n=1 Tax=uncultured Campylobacter sp. TaxID=218934 RepID=UPI0026390AF2|nr:peptide MFS transporter [uncultured Campylobacter sp.]
MKKNDLNTAFLGHPKPLMSLSAVEFWERFSYYGIRALLVFFMSAGVLSGGLGLGEENASAIMGIFAGALYLATLPGGYIADNYLGQKRAVFMGAVVVALGHLSIAFSYFYSFMFYIGLVLIVIGTGLFKTCSSVMVGMLYKQNDTRRDAGFTLFYMGINLGALIAPLICGFFSELYGWHIGLGIGGLGMLLSLAIFYFKTIPDFEEFEKNIGVDSAWKEPVKKQLFLKYVIIFSSILLAIFIALCIFGVVKLNPVAIATYMTVIIALVSLLYFIVLLFLPSVSLDEKKNLFLFVILFIASAFFWSVFEQQPTTYNLFAKDFMDRMIFNFEIPATWFQALNSFFIIIFAPLLSFLWIFLAKRQKDLDSMSKFVLGLVFAGLAFLIMYFAALSVLENSQNKVSYLWMVASLFCLTIGELCLSPVGMSIMTKIAPKILQNQVMGLFFVSISLGNLVAGLIGGGVNLENINNLPNIFMNCVIMLFVVAFIVFVIKKPIYKILKKDRI